MCANEDDSQGQSSKSTEEDAAENAVKAQFRLASAVQLAAGQLADCLENMRSLQNGLMSAVQEYLGLNIAGFDEPTLALVQGCASLFQDSSVLLEQALHGTGCLRSLPATCDHVMQECNRITSLLQARGQAMHELRHYSEKVSKLQQVAAQGKCSSERFARNQSKLDHAREKAQASDRQCKEELSAFQGRCVHHSNGTVLALLEAYVRVLAGCGQGAYVLLRFGDEDRRADMAAGQQHAGEGEHLIDVSRTLPPETQPKKEVNGSLDFADVVIKPSFGSCRLGCDAIVRCNSLSKQISEVYIGEEPVEILEAQSSWARIRVPPGSVAGAKRVEVRTTDWCQHVAMRDAAFEYFEPLAFGHCGQNAKLEVAYGAQPGELPTVAFRSHGLLHGLALTATPLPSSFEQSALQRYYFEVEVLRAAEKPRGTTRTVSIGFTWFDAAGLGSLPEQASQLPCALVAGGDLPRAHLDGRELGKLSGWRPLLEVGDGTVLGAMLEVEATVLRLIIFQDGKRRCSVEAVLDQSRTGEPHGVIDVCGTVQKVALRQRSVLPEIGC